MTFYIVCVHVCDTANYVWMESAGYAKRTEKESVREFDIQWRVLVGLYRLVLVWCWTRANYCVTESQIDFWMISRFIIRLAHTLHIWVHFPFICANCVGNKIEINFLFSFLPSDHKQIIIIYVLRAHNKQWRKKNPVFWFANLVGVRALMQLQRCCMCVCVCVAFLHHFNTAMMMAKRRDEVDGCQH